MNRRDALRNMSIFAGGIVLVPSCDFSKEDILVAYDKLKVTPHLQELLTEIVDTIIPAGEIKGASDLEVHDFVLVMVNDCLNKDMQNSFMKGFNEFASFSKEYTGKNFKVLDREQREHVINGGLKDNSEEKADVRKFLYTTKELSIQGFLMSEYIQTEIKPYSLIPGDYQGEVLISSLKSEKINA